ncbi:MAG: 50S ribosomal protein L10 [Acidobacteriota bacterium]
MNREEKQQTIDTLNEQFRSIQSAFLIDFRGVKVVEATELRRKIREVDGSYFVVKNTLAMLAAKETELDQLKEHFQGPTAIAYHEKDIVGLAKVLNEISKSNPNFQFKAALVEGKVVPTSEIKALASMPSREVLLSKLAFLLKAPLQNLATVLKAPLRDLGLVLKQIEK